jgi:hypothetical protein
MNGRLNAGELIMLSEMMMILINMEITLKMKISWGIFKMSWTDVKPSGQFQQKGR